MLTINSKEDLEKLPLAGPKDYLIRGWIDFEKLKKQGIDSIYLTSQGVWRTRFIHPVSLYSWDCETLLILNEKCILNWKIS